MKRFNKSEIQSLVFPKNKFSISEAKKWAKTHDFKANKADVTKNNIRIRQFNPNQIKRGGECRTIHLGSSSVQGVLCEVGVMRKKRDIKATPNQKEILKKLKNKNSILTKGEIQIMLNVINKDDTTEVAKEFLIGAESADEGFKITPEQTEQGLNFLKRERSKGVNRDQFENSIAGEVLDDFKSFGLMGFREVNLEKGRTIPFYVPQWVVFSKNDKFPEFHYYWEGKLVING